MERVQNVYSFKGGKAVAMTMEIINYIASPYVNTTHRTVIGALLRAGVYDRGSALGIDEITELAAYSDRDYVGKALGSLTVSQLVIQFRSKDRKKKFYLNRDFASPIGKTVLAEKVFTKQEPTIKKEKKLTPPKKENPEAREIFNIYLKLYPKKGAYMFRQEKIERAIKDYDFETIKAIIEWFPSNTWWNEKSKVDLYKNIIAPTRIDGWISEMSVKPKFKAEEKKVNTTPRNISDAEMNYLE